MQENRQNASYYWIIPVLLALVVTVSNSSCSRTLRYDLSADQTEDVCVFNDSVADLNLAKIYLEASIGMRGYTNPSTISDENFALKTFLPRLVTDLPSRGIETRLYLQKTDAPQPIALNPITGGVTTGTIFSGASDLSDYFPGLIRDTRANEISFLISDCIYDIVGADNLSQQQTATDNIYRALHANDFLAAIVYVYYSSFYADRYFNMDTHVRPFQNSGVVMEKRPIYVWVFGTPSNLQSFSDLNLLTDYDAIFSYGLYPSASPKTKLIRSYRQGKIALLKSNGFIAHKPKPGDVIKMALGIDLSGFSEAIQDTAFLNQHLTLDKPYLQNNIFSKVYYKEDFTNTIDGIRSADKLRLEQEIHPYTHIIEVEINSIVELPDSSFSLVLFNRQPEWISEVHLSDDRHVALSDVSLLEGKTPLFNVVSRAFKERYLKEECVLFDLVFTLNN